MRRRWRLALSERVYRALIRLYPSDFATEHREDLLEIFRDRWRVEHERGGAFPATRVWSVLVRDLGQTVPALRRPAPTRRVPVMRNVLNDVRLAGRMMRRRPYFTFMATATLALGIGPTVALFAALEQLVLDPVAAAGGERVVQVVFHSDRLGFAAQPRVVHFRAWQDEATSFEVLTAHSGTARTLTGAGDARVVGVRAVEPGIFALMGIDLVVGRPIVAADTRPGAERVALLTSELWRARFGADEEIVGRSVMLDDVPHAVVGVVGETVALSAWANTDVLVAAREWEPTTSVGVLGRLRPAVTREAAQDELRGVVAEPMRPGWVATVQAPQVLAGNHVRSLWIVFAAVCLVLIIAASNVANMLLARGIDRSGELALRTALGASRGRLTAMLLVENLLLAAIGGAAAVVLVRWVHAGIVALAPEPLSALQRVSMNATSVLFAAALTLATGIVAGLIPAWRTGGRRPGVRVRAHARAGRSRAQGHLRQSLVAAQVALALVVFAGAGLTVRSFVALRNADPGFDPSGMAVMGVHLPEPRYELEERRETFYRELVDGLRALPAVEHVTLASGLPTRFGIMFATPEIEGHSGPIADLGTLSGSSVGPEYFETVGTRVIEGRAFGDDLVGTPVVAVNVSAARQLWPAGDAVGSRIRFGGQSPWHTVVGVVEDIRAHGMRSDGTDRPQVYIMQNSWRSRIVAVAVKHQGAFAPVRDAIVRVTRSIDADVPVDPPQPAAAMLVEAVAAERFTTALFGVLAGLSLALAAVGIFSVVSFVVSSRTSELGVRIAMGATGTDVVRSVLGHGMRPVLVGVTGGLVLAVALSRYAEHLVYGIAAWDPATLAVAAGVLVMVAALACVVPARRATRIDPVAAMRTE